mgnify:CR=1 FL=1
MAMRIDFPTMELLQLIVAIIENRHRFTLVRGMVFVLASGILAAFVHFGVKEDDFRPILFIGAIMFGFILAFGSPFVCQSQRKVRQLDRMQRGPFLLRGRGQRVAEASHG